MKVTSESGKAVIRKGDYGTIVKVHTVGVPKFVIAPLCDIEVCFVEGFIHNDALIFIYREGKKAKPAPCDIEILWQIGGE